MKTVVKIKISALLLFLFCLKTAAQNVGINQLNPQYPLDILAGQSVIRMITTDSSFGSVIELRNIKTASQYLGAVNFNDSINNHPGQLGYLTNHNLTFRTNYGERMRIDPFGRIGIGTTVPQWPIDIRASQGVVGITTTTANFGSGLELRNLNTAAEYIGAINFNDLQGSYPGQIGYLSNHNLTFRTGQLERMRINPLGNVGIGTTTPEYPIDVKAPQSVLRLSTTSSIFGSVLELRNLYPFAAFLGAINFNDSNNLHPGQIGYLWNHNLMFKTNYNERMRIDSLGRIGIGTTTPQWPIDVVANDAVARFRSTSVDGSGIILRNMAPSSDLLGYLEFQGPTGQTGSWIGGLPSKDLVFVVNNTEYMRINPFGRIGIGTSVPQWPIDIRAFQGVIGITTTFNSNGSVIDLRNIYSAAEYLGAINFNNSIGSYPGQIGYLSNNHMIFRTNLFERMRIDSLGRVGIGTTTPQWPVDVMANQGVMRLTSATANNGSVVELRNLNTGAQLLGAINFNNNAGSHPGQIAYHTNNNLTFTTLHQEHMRIDAIGNIGIGTSLAAKTIDIQKPVGTIRINSTASDNGSDLELRSSNGASQYLGSIFFNNSDNSYPGRIAYHTNHILEFNVQNQERMRIDPDGRLGIGRIPTDNILEVEGNCYVQSGLGIGKINPQWPIDMEADQSVARLITTNSVNGSGIELRNDVANPVYLGAINFNNSINSYPGQIGYLGDHNMTFRVNGAERVRINSTGLTGVGRVPVTNKLEVEGNASKSSAGDWLANSDGRLKKNIKALNSNEMLQKLLDLRGVSFEWNDDKTGTIRPEGEHYGFIAQDIQETFPALVEEDNLGYLQTAYGTYDPMIVEAIRALDEKIRILQAENETLKKQLGDIMNMLKEKIAVSREP